MTSYLLAVRVVTMGLLLSVLGCNRASGPEPQPAPQEPVAVHELREKASKRGLKWDVFQGGFGLYLAFATDGSMSLGDCRDHWSAEGKRAEDAASNLSKALDGPHNVLVRANKFNASLYGCVGDDEKHYSSLDTEKP